jgi:hypothetical protein
MPDLFVNRQSELDSPAYEAFAITANGSELDTWTRYVYVGGAGSMQAVMANGGTVMFTGLQNGQLLPVRVKAIGSATSASGLVGLA